jgi:hypothetical protein
LCNKKAALAAFLMFDAKFSVNYYDYYHKNVAEQGWQRLKEVCLKFFLTSQV